MCQAGYPSIMQTTLGLIVWGYSSVTCPVLLGCGSQSEGLSKAYCISLNNRQLAVWDSDQKNVCSELTACLFYFHCAGWGFDCWLGAEGSCGWRHSWSAFQGGEGIRCVTSGLVQGEKGETTIIREMRFSYFEAFSCSMHLGFPFWSDFFVSYTQCYTCWEVLQSFDFSSVLVRPSDSFALWFDCYDHSRSFSISYCWSVSDYQFDFTDEQFDTLLWICVKLLWEVVNMGLLLVMTKMFRK